MPPSARRVWFNVHLWIGLALTLVLAPIGVTGSVLVWRQALAQPPGATGTADRPIGAYVDAARAAGVEGRATQVRLPLARGEAVAVTLRAPDAAPATVWLDPATARVLRVDRRPGGWLGAVHELHETLMAGRPGGWIVGASGLALFVSAATGLWLWFPRLGGLAAALRWRRTALLSLNLHHQLGFWICAPLAVLSLTGAWLAFGDSGPRGPEAGRGEGRRTAAAAGPRIGFDDVAGAVLARHPGAKLASIAAPAGGGAWRVQLRSALGERLSLSFDPASGQERASGPPANGFRRAMHQLHGGEETPLAWRLVITAAGLAPAILGLTGIWAWARRRRPVRTASAA
ncbi:MAG TPA: PepSY-associated TM helix domain-containing protein [Caulobacteraceae bacterium]|nr:PepSY-associated TM helix domain-containing protein [Caulobacteraceae bacterium]